MQRVTLPNAVHSFLQILSFFFATCQEITNIEPFLYFLPNAVDALFQILTVFLLEFDILSPCFTIEQAQGYLSIIDILSRLTDFLVQHVLSCERNGVP